MSPRKLELDLSQWPQPCTGNCGRILRPPHTKAAEWPQVVTRASQRVSEPWCETCSAALKGKRGGHRKELGAVEPEAVRLERIRSELRSMIADRRRRGVPSEGIVMPGDEKMRYSLQRQIPGEPPQDLVPHTLPLEETVSEDAPLGLCQKGHAFTHRDPSGRRACTVCRNRQAEKRKGKARRLRGTCHKGHPFTHRDAAGRQQCTTCREELLAKRKQDAAELAMHGGVELCRRGHAYTHISSGRKYCPECKKMSRDKLAAARQAQNDA